MPTTAIPRGGVTRVADLTALKARHPGQNDVVYVRAEDDLFVWDRESTETPDDVDVLLRNGQAEETAGRWIREVRPASALDADGERLTVGEIADGSFLQRVGDEIVGGSPSATGVVIPRDYAFTAGSNTTSITLPRPVSAGWEASVSMFYGAIPYVRATSAPATGQFRIVGSTVTVGDTVLTGHVVVFKWLEPGS